jgi:hypothetical protein
MQSNILQNIKVDNELAWFFGFSTGDGYITYGRYGVDTITSEIVKLLINNLMKITTVPIKTEIYGNPEKFKLSDIKTLHYQKRKSIHSEHIKIKVDNVEFARKMQKLQKEIIENINNFPKETICNFLQGFFDAEATVSPSGIVEIDLSLENQKITELISKLLNTLGIENKFFVYPSKTRITIPGGTKKINNLKSFREYVGFRITKKKIELNDMISIYSLQIDNRARQEISELLLNLLQKHKHLEFKKCMKELSVKWKTLKRCANTLSDSGRISQFQKRKRVCLEYLN